LVRVTQPAAVQSVDRALQILRAFESGTTELRVTDLAAHLGVHKSTASRLAATLVAHEFLERSENAESFRLGSRLVRLGMVAGGRDLVDVARPAMDELAAATGETVVLSLSAGSDSVDVAQVDSRFLLGGKQWLGLRSPLHTTAAGKVLLAFGAAELPRDARLARLGPRTISSRASLERELAKVRAAGWARAAGEYEDGLNGVAAPIRSADGRCVAALSVSGPAYRLPPAKLPALGRRCADAAATISATFDWSRHAA
jgi:DNA-binding IclR family transcriptional regulator